MEMILFVGLPGSGKSTFYKNHYFNTHLRISNDLLRTKNRTQKLLDFCRETNMSFVIDNTCTTKEVRKRFIDYCNSIRAPLRKSCVFFDTPIGVCIERNNNRTGKERVPKTAILMKAKELERPSLEEGFDELIIIDGGDK